jgi:hypothetical protein
VKHLLALCLVALGCRATSLPPPRVVDCGTLDGSHCDLATFLRACQRASGHNFTWTKETAARLETAIFDGPSRVEVPAARFDGWLDETLARHGFTARAVGPAHLDVLLVTARDAR